MKTEQVTISFIAVIIGIIFAGLLFYFYQQMNQNPVGDQAKKISKNVLETIPTPAEQFPLTIKTPENEQIVTSKTLKVSGTTSKDATVIVTNGIEDQITKTADGSFSISINLEDGVNEIVITAILPNGQETQKQITVSYSTESF